jgi:hypothetical protein
MDNTCHLCNQPTYKHIRSGPVCRGHYIKALERQLGIHAPKFKSYQQARAGWNPAPLPLPLFQGMEKTS